MVSTNFKSNCLKLCSLVEDLFGFDYDDLSGDDISLSISSWIFSFKNSFMLLLSKLSTFEDFASRFDKIDFFWPTKFFVTFWNILSATKFLTATSLYVGTSASRNS